MPGVWQRVLGGIVLLLLVGWAIGAYFGYPIVGVLVAFTGIFVMHLYRLLELERTLTLRKKVNVIDGDGPWARVLAGIRYQQQRVRRHKGRYRRLMKEIRQSTNALPDGVIALTELGEITRFNAAAQLLLGLQRKRDRGQRIDNLVRHPDFVAYLASADYAGIVVIPAPRREDGWLSLQVVPYNDNNRLLVVRDVTERTRMNRMRRDFVANASHELRTPLTVISGYLEALLGDDDATGEWQAPLQEMTQQAHRMRVILDELLALSRLEASASASMEKIVDVSSVIRECTALSENKARRIYALVETEAQLLGEYSEITSVVSNLISNALRYSPDDTPVHVTWSDDEESCVLQVTDQGEGIAPEDVPRLTERFFRVNRGRGRDSGGVGLGLAIVKHALARHDAGLEIESELGVGSTITCRFPMERLIFPNPERVPSEAEPQTSAADVAEQANHG